MRRALRENPQRPFFIADCQLLIETPDLPYAAQACLVFFQNRELRIQVSALDQLAAKSASISGDFLP
jgi:hypothetical protein